MLGFHSLFSKTQTEHANSSIGLPKTATTEQFNNLAQHTTPASARNSESPPQMRQFFLCLV